jgi:ribonuclease HI
MAQKRQSPKFYAVRKGRQPGIYRTWEECQAEVDGFAGAQFKSFPTEQAARDYLAGVEGPKPPSAPRKVADAEPAPIAHPGQVVIYADGACIRNPGPGGYGVVILEDARRRELSAGFRLTTNNRMEILGCIVGLSAIEQPSDIAVYSDSRYVVNAISQSWASRWQKNGWRRKTESDEWQEALNSDLWMQMLDLCDKHRVRFYWVRGHAGNPENERCDELARNAATKGPLAIDHGYERAKRQARLLG